MKKATRSNQPNKPPKPEQLGQMLVNIYESGYMDRTQSYKMSFIKGVLGGLGGAIGATVVLALLIWILSLFSHAPLIGRVVDNIQQTVNSRHR